VQVREDRLGELMELKDSFTELTDLMDIDLPTIATPKVSE